MKLLSSLFILTPSLLNSFGLEKAPGGLILAWKIFCSRKATIHGFLLGLALAMASVQSQADIRTPSSFSGKVSGVRSGHTLIVQEGDRTHKVNLYGVISPSPGAPQAEKARAFLEQIAFGRMVKVEAVAPLSPRVLYAFVQLGDQNLNEEMIRQGLAWVNQEACAMEICQRWKTLQEEAKAAQRGIWSDPSKAPLLEKGRGKSRPKRKGSDLHLTPKAPLASPTGFEPVLPA